MDKDQEIYELRKLLWSMHGHKDIYGDDGELQCHQCWHEYGFYDWKREPIENILKGIQEGNLRKLANPQINSDLATISPETGSSREIAHKRIDKHIKY